MNYIPIDAILNYVPKAVRENSDQSDLLSYALDAYLDINARQATASDIKVAPITNHIATVPEGTKSINTILYTDTLSAEDKKELCGCIVCPSDTECTNCGGTITCGTPGIYFTNDQYAYCGGCFDCITESLGSNTSTANICRHTLNYQLALNSHFYTNTVTPLKFVGNSKSTLVPKTPSKINSYANDTWAFNPTENQIITSIKEGYLVINRQMALMDLKGNFLIIDLPIVKKALAAYASAMYLENRMYAHEQAAIGNFERALVKAELLLKRAKGTILLRGVDDNAVREISGADNYNARFMKSPFHVNKSKRWT